MVPPPKKLHGIYLGFLAFLFYSLADTCLKYLGNTPIPHAQTLFLLTLFSTLFLAGPLLLTGKAHLLKPHRIKTILAVGLIGVVGSTANFFAFTYLPMTTVYIAYLTTPLLVSLIGITFLKEPLERSRTALLFISFLGALYALDPTSINTEDKHFWAWVLLPILPCTFAALSLSLRFLRETETPQVLTTYPPAIRASFFLPFGLYVWTPISWEQLFIFIFAGLLYASGHLSLTYAYKIAAGTLVSPTQYVQLAYGAVIGYIVWNDIPTMHTVFGSLIIIISGLAAAKLTHKQAATT